ncbi:multidrug resistance-associated protein 1 [Nilaparvata lugens]|uniref:multidrug resistance-associated protein 1 n=1 Tax=Nilaparvata lugens TaxID=108931 RepID=UPI00193D01DC|nr:multidrug resistance-associated protein 1 [Nilaparvata lugens]
MSPFFEAVQLSGIQKQNPGSKHYLYLESPVFDNDNKYQDFNETLETGRLDSTPCFEQTLLIWFPLIIFWLFSPLEIYYIRNSTLECIPWNLVNSSRVIVTALLITSSLIELVHYENEGIYKRIALVYCATPFLKLISFSFSLVLVLWNRRKGLPRSGLHFWLWTFLASCGVIQLCREVMSLEKDHQSEIFQPVSYLAYYLLILLNFILTFFKDSLPKGKKYNDSIGEMCPDAIAAYPTVLVASWIRPILRKANRGKIYEEDLFELKDELATENIIGEFEKHYSDVQEEKHRQDGSQWKITRSKLFLVFAKCFIRTFLFGLLLATLYLIAYFMNPQVLRLILVYSDHERRIWENVAYPAIACCLALSLTILQSQYLMRLGMISLKTRVIFISEIFKKALKLSVESRKNESTGEIVNLMNVDVHRITETIKYVNRIWATPLRIFLAMYSLYFEIGYSVIAAFVLLLTFIVIQIIMGFYTKYYTSKCMHMKDNRMKILSEALSHMRVLKFYVWEPSFLKMINELRSREIYYLRKLYYIHITSVFLSTCTPFLMTLVSFSYYVLEEGNILTAEVAFVSLVLFEMLQLPLSRLPNVILGTIQLAVSYNRIARFLNAEELEVKMDVRHDGKDDIGTASIINGYFAWGDSIVLKQISLNLPKGCSKAIFGPTGGGKSSILAALAGEILKMSGFVSTKGKIATVSQVPWIQNESVRDVILFGKAFDNKLYDKTIRACYLHDDLESFTRGDLTLIGSKGLNLSLGQKQQICLARAVYSEADVYLLDDPVSALDERLAKRVFRRVISDQGILAGKTRLVVTTNLDYLHYFDSVILIENGKIVAEAEYKQLLKTGKLLSLLRNWSDLKLMRDQKQFWAVRISDDAKRKSSTLLNGKDSAKNYNADTMVVGSSPFYRPSLYAEQFTGTSTSILSGSEENESISAGKLRCSVFWKYLHIMGRSNVINSVVFGILVEVFYFLGTFWLASWTQQHDNPNIKQESIFYVSVYASFGIGFLVSMAIFSYSIYMGALKASISFHNELLNSVFRFPMSFFDQTPLGRLLNRFGGDVYTMDSQLPLNMQYYISTSFRIMGVLVITLQYYPIVFPVFVTVILSYLLLQNYFLNTSRQLALLETKSRTPIFSHFEEALSGVTVIRAYKAEEKFIGVNRSNIQKNLSIAYHTVIANRWLDLRMETIGHIFLFFVIGCVLFTPYFNASMIGLAISYVIQMTSNLNILVQHASSINSDCVSAERINEYIERTKEPTWDSAPIDVPQDWPKYGAIKFDKFLVQYQNSRHIALNEISFTVLPNEKISIVGRTGSGKTTLMHSLFRIIEGKGGSILIDGVDISQVGLGRLRSSLNIIPQDPVLFSGTLRMNLDPGNEFSDSELWQVLHESHLGHLATELSDGLNHVVEGTSSFSVGERQMICIARALLKKSNILIIDEATSQIDWWIESLMKKAINEHFSQCTILSVDHRLKNVLDSDRVLVLSKGKVVELDTPQKLLENHDGVFYSLAVEAGLIRPEQELDNLNLINDKTELKKTPSSEQVNSIVSGESSLVNGHLDELEENVIEMTNLASNYRITPSTSESSSTNAEEPEPNDQEVHLSSQNIKTQVAREVISEIIDNATSLRLFEEENALIHNDVETSSSTVQDIPEIEIDDTSEPKLNEQKLP